MFKMNKYFSISLLSVVALLSAASLTYASNGQDMAVVERTSLLVIQLSVILFSAWLGGVCFNKLHLPCVLGEILSGVLIGPYCLGQIPFLGFANGMFPVPGTFPVSIELYSLATIASITLLFFVGLETDIQTFLRFSFAGSVLGIFGVIFSFAAGDYVGILVSEHLLGQKVGIFSPVPLMLGVISTATSVGISARILSQRKKMNSPEGVSILAAAVIDDVLGIIILAIVVGMAKSGHVGVKEVSFIALKAFAMWIGFTALGIRYASSISNALKKVGDRTVIAVLGLGLAFLLAGIFEKSGLAGVIGLSVASCVAREGRNVFVLEKNDSWGQEISSRNSEVIHAGIYYKQGSLKAISCREGREALYALCPQHGIGIKKTGKLIVAVDENEVSVLKEIQKVAKNNDVNLIFLDREEVKKMEPSVSAIAALYSAETGIVDSHFLMKHFLDKAVSKGADLVCQAEVVEIEKQGSQYKIEINNQGERISVLSTVVVNCAGNNADKIASICGIDIKRQGYEQYYLKGNYFRLSDKYRNMTNHLVYPVPDKNSLGIHTVLDLSGGIRLGPDEEEVKEIDYKVTESKKKMFYESVKRFLPDIKEEDISSDMSGIRPQLRQPNVGDFKDFVVSHEEDKGLAGLINLIGIESPGLTASSFLGKHVSGMVDKILKN